MEFICNWLSGLDSGGVGNLISTFTALAAIIGLIYQVRMNRKQVKLQNFIEYTKRYQEIILGFPEGINRTDFSIQDQPEDKREKVMRLMRAYMDLCFEEYLLHKKGFIDDDLWEIWEGGMKTAFSKKSFRDAWALIKQDTEYGAEFNKFANDFGLG